MKHYEKDEETKSKVHMVAITTLSVIGAVIVFILICVMSVKSFIDDLSMHKYYVLEINKENKNQVISLLKGENQKYCESIYKIEYEQLFTGDKSGKIYCQNEEDIFLNISDDSSIADYIYKNGIIEKR